MNDGVAFALRLVTPSACSSLPAGVAFCLCRWLTSNKLTGAIPDSLGSLSSLQQLCVPVRWLFAHAIARDGMSGLACQLRRGGNASGVDTTRYWGQGEAMGR